jgi:WD40 repeat-containing protein SMU1
VHTGQLSPYALSSGSTAPDLLRGGVTTRVIRDEAPVRSVLGGFTLSYGSGPARPAVGLFTLDGTMLILGGGDGLIEIYDAGGVGGGGSAASSSATTTPKLSPLCPYQARDEFLVHEDGITALAASRDGELLASASRDGEIKVWRIKTGECLRKFMEGGGGGGGSGSSNSAASAVVALAFTGDGGTLLAGGVDGVGRLWGLRSGKCLAELRGHGAHITGACLWMGVGWGRWQ